LNAYNCKRGDVHSKLIKLKCQNELVRCPGVAGIAVPYLVWNRICKSGSSLLKITNLMVRKTAL